MFLEFNCGHFGTKMESLRPSYQKLVFCPYMERAWPKKGVAINLVIAAQAKKVCYDII